MSEEARRNAEDMRKRGISKLPKWGRPKNVGYATLREKLPAQQCQSAGCAKNAGYQTPGGLLCFQHALECNQEQSK